VRGFLDALGVDPPRIVVGLPAQAAKLRSLLARLLGETRIWVGPGAGRPDPRAAAPAEFGAR
jgi:hypothetical protein